jgi:hypothetical protein
MTKQKNTQTAGVRNHRKLFRVRNNWWILFVVIALMVFGCEKDVGNNLSDEIDGTITTELPDDNQEKMQGGRTYEELVLQNDDMDDIFDQVIVMSALPDWVTRYFVLNRAEIQSDRLKVSVSYAGGCRPHYFRLVSTKFLGEKPLQVNVQIFHFSADDPCDSWITEEIEYDLSPLKALYLEEFEKIKGKIVINLIDVFASQENAPLVYEFSDATRKPPPGITLPPQYVNGTW